MVTPSLLIRRIYRRWKRFAYSRCRTDKWHLLSIHRYGQQFGRRGGFILAFNCRYTRNNAKCADHGCSYARKRTSQCLVHSADRSWNRGNTDHFIYCHFRSGWNRQHKQCFADNSDRPDQRQHVSIHRDGHERGRHKLALVAVKLGEIVSEPGQPVNLAAVVLGSSIQLTWSAPGSTGGSDITDYIVEYQLTTGGTWSVFADGTSINTTALVTGLSNNVSYDFRVRAVNIIGQSIPSNVATATPGEPAQVLIQSFTGLNVPKIYTAVRITNEGTSQYEYQYTWCVTDSDTNLCGSGDGPDIFSSTAAKLVASHENYDFTATSTVPIPGNYWFHIQVLYGSQS